LANGHALGSNSYPYGEPVLGLTLPNSTFITGYQFVYGLGLITSAVWVSECCRIKKQES
jgi:hypothetical protein